MNTALLKKYLRVPLLTAPLLVIVFFSLLLALAVRAGIFGLPLMLILVSWFFKYSFVVLDAVVDGRAEPPAMSIEMMNPVEQRPFGLFLVMLVFYVITMGLESMLSSSAITAIRIIALTVVPAMIATMSISGRFIDAINPAGVGALIARVPVQYATLLLTIAALWLVPYVVTRAAIHWLLPGLYVGITSAIPSVLLYALAMYLWLAMCALTGGLVYEHRDELGYEPAESPERSAEKKQRELDVQYDRMMDTIFAEVRGGALQNAGATVRKHIETAANPLDTFRWMYARAKRWPDQRLAEYLVQLCLPRLLAARANAEALTVVRERVRVNGAFRPETGGSTIQMATLACDVGDRSTARMLLADFESHFPNDPLTARAVELRSQLQR